MLTLDHITIAACTLTQGLAYAERVLGVAIPPGGAHPLMGTHNHLLRLGGSLFLEVIAPNPDAGPISRRRWFALDDPSMLSALATSPRLATWVVSTPDVRAALSRVPHATGPAILVTRGTLEWLMSVPPDGSMPFNGAFPTFMEWPSGPHPASRMPDLGCSLVELEIFHPEAEVIRDALAPFLDDPRVRFSRAEAQSMRATIRTPNGDRMVM